MGITTLGKASRNREHREVGGFAIGNLIPAEGSRAASVGQWGHGIGRAGGPVLWVLVVVEKDSVALLFPPFRARQSRYSAFDSTRQRERCAPYLGECPMWLNSDIHVHSARATRLGPTTESILFKHRLDLESHQADVWPRNAWTGIEVYAQLVGVIEVRSTYRMRVEFDTTEVDDPGKTAD